MVQLIVVARCVPPLAERFCDRQDRSIPQRTTYVLFASLALILLFWQWRPLPNVIWHIENPPAAVAVTAGSFIGWLVVLTSTFLINRCGAGY
ncbi:protein-S-isoprenylcysteine O-methyltransferase Ste14 [Bradyrhizobium sp. i1.4.4]